MTQQEFEQKWGNVNVDELPDLKLQEFKDDCFRMYEATGFTDIFNSPYDDERGHNGMKFEVVRRATNKECDLEAMPLWFVKFENGDTAYCYPEEICLIGSK